MVFSVGMNFSTLPIEEMVSNVSLYISNLK